MLEPENAIQPAASWATTAFDFAKCPEPFIYCDISGYPPKLKTQTANQEINYLNVIIMKNTSIITVVRIKNQMIKNMEKLNMKGPAGGQLIIIIIIIIFIIIIIVKNYNYKKIINMIKPVIITKIIILNIITVVSIKIFVGKLNNS